MADNPSVAKPASGTYGETTDLDNLKKALPVGAIGNPAPAPEPPPLSGQPTTQPMPTPVGRPPGATPPPGVPAVLADPTSQPDTPVNTPLSVPAAPTPAVADPRQARMAILDALANDPNVSPETQEWAKTVISILLKH